MRSWRVVESRGPVAAERPSRPIRCARLAVAGLVVGGVVGLRGAARCRCPRQAEISGFSADELRAQPGGRPRRHPHYVVIRQAQIQRAGGHRVPVEVVGFPSEGMQGTVVCARTAEIVG